MDMFLNTPKMWNRISTHGHRLQFNLSQALAPKRAGAGNPSDQVWRVEGRESSWPCWVHCPGASKPAYPRLTKRLITAERMHPKTQPALDPGPRPQQPVDRWERRPKPRTGYSLGAERRY